MNESQSPPPRPGLIGRLFGRGAEPKPDVEPTGPVQPFPQEETPDVEHEPSIPTPGPDVIPLPEPEMPPAPVPEPELPPRPGSPQPEYPGTPEPEVIPPPGLPGPEMPGTGLPEPEIPTPGTPGFDIPPPLGPDVVPPPGLPPIAPAMHRTDDDDDGLADDDGVGTAAEREERVSWLARLRRGLGRSSAKLTHGIGALFGRRKLDDEALEDLEDLLIGADLGVETARRLAGALSKTRFDQEVTADEVRAALASEVAGLLAPVAQTIAIHDRHRPHVILVCGVNGSGKTTTIAKMARLFRSVGFRVVLAAGDTFRAAAIEQLQIWGERIGCEVIARAPGADPASLAYEAYAQAKADGADVLIIDTAGRLQNKADLMAELQKIARILKRLDEHAPHDVILVLDASVGQNAHAQVDVFRQMVEVSGLVVTKLDGSAKGGVVVSLAHRFGLPVYFLGVGEGMDDMRAFDPQVFARSLLGLDA